MKKIKLVISDFHIGRGRRLPDGSTNLLEEFYYDDHISEFLNYYTSGEYLDYEIELIVNGDFLNFLQVDYRGHFLTVVTESIAAAQLKSIVEGHPTVFNALRKFTSGGKNRVTYVVGNHDQSMLWPACRKIFDEAVGSPVNYKNIVYFFDGVHIEHGHMHEAANRLNARRFFLKKDLPEAILNLPFGSHFFVEFVLKVKKIRPHVDKVRPFQAFVRWGLVHDTIFTARTMVALFWFFLKKTFFSSDYRRQWPVRHILEIFKEGAIFPDLSYAARKILEDERVHTVVFGHTHVYQYRQFGPAKEYFNTGTWTELTSLDINWLGKITKLTYVLLEYPEDGGRPRGRLKEWRGYTRVEKDVEVS